MYAIRSYYDNFKFSHYCVTYPGQHVCQGIAHRHSEHSLFCISNRQIKCDVQAAYQLDLVTPVIRPLDASLRKQILQMPNLRMKARGRPHNGHLLYFVITSYSIHYTKLYEVNLTSPLSIDHTLRVLSSDPVTRRSSCICIHVIT